MKNELRDLQPLIIANIESITLRHVAGKGDQALMTIVTHYGEIEIRLIPWSVVKPMRVIDLRRRGRAKARKQIEMSPENIERFVGK